MRRNQTSRGTIHTTINKKHCAKLSAMHRRRMGVRGSGRGAFCVTTVQMFWKDARPCGKAPLRTA